MTEHINLKFSGNDKGDDQKGNIWMLPRLLQLPALLLLALLLPHYYIYNIKGKFELNQKTLCACTLTKECISRIDLGIKLELSENA